MAIRNYLELGITIRKVEMAWVLEKAWGAEVGTS